MKTIKLSVGLGTALCAFTATMVHAADFDPQAAHQPLMEAFNDRDWDGMKSVLAEDAVFHRANSGDVYSGPDAIVDRFSSTIGNAEEWNVKFAKLDSQSATTGTDGRVVDGGDFAITAGADDSACYAGSYMATWAPADDGWKLQTFSWQDVETGPEKCK